MDILELNEQHDHPENVESTLRMPNRERKLTISSDYVVYLQELNFYVKEPLMIQKLFYKP